MNDLEPYISLIDSMPTDQIDARTFEREYLALFKNDNARWPEAEYDILNDLFTDVDAFCEDPDLRGPDDLSATELRERARISLQRLREIARSQGP